MTYYYAHESHRWLTVDEQQRFHIDYDPQPTKHLAMKELRRFLIRGIIQEWSHVWWRVIELVKTFYGNN